MSLKVTQSSVWLLAHGVLSYELTHTHTLGKHILSYMLTSLSKESVCLCIACVCACMCVCYAWPWFEAWYSNLRNLVYFYTTKEICYVKAIAWFWAGGGVFPRGM